MSSYYLLVTTTLLKTTTIKARLSLMYTVYMHIMYTFYFKNR